MFLNTKPKNIAGLDSTMEDTCGETHTAKYNIPSSVAGNFINKFSNSNANANVQDDDTVSLETQKIKIFKNYKLKKINGFNSRVKIRNIN